MLKQQNRDARKLNAEKIHAIKQGAIDRAPINGFTHRFYRYPARFSPQFVRAVVQSFSEPGDVVLDPYMGGGTTIVEALATGRVAVGCDLNSLAVFLADAKVSPLSAIERKQITCWASQTVAALSYHDVSDEVADLVCSQRTKNLSLPRARPVKKLIAQALLGLRVFDTDKARNFARCVLLNVAQWALNNRKSAPTLNQVRKKVGICAIEMLEGLAQLRRAVDEHDKKAHAFFIHDTAANLPQHKPFIEGLKADLVVTSPPYPGIHILYHRWQIDGRKETPAPYWIADRFDGKGSSFYNFADRREDAEAEYFAESLKTLKALRSVVKDNALVVQLIAFSRPTSQLRKYLTNMETAGFKEVRSLRKGRIRSSLRRIWRAVPSRAWYANLRGKTCSSREVVLIHRAC